MIIEFAKPIFLLLLIPAVYFIVEWYRGSYADLSVRRRWTSFVLRLLTVLLLCFSLAGLRWVRRSENLSVLFLVDVSQSISSEGKELAKSIIQDSVSRMKPSDTAGVIVFGADALVETSPQVKPKIDKFTSTPNTDFTDIGKALQLGMAVFPKESAKRMVLISDGNENLGNSLDQAVLAKTNGIEIDTIPVGTEKSPEVSVENLVVPGKSQLGEPVEIKAVINSNVETRGTLRLFRNGTYIASKDVNLSPGKNLVSFMDERKEPGITRYEVLIEAEKDTISENNVAYGYTAVSGEPRILLVSGNPKESANLYSALQTENLQTELRSSQDIPQNLTDLANYDVCIFDDVSALALNNNQMKMIQSYVRDMGGGFIMLGGEDSFGMGGYYQTPVEEALPVDMDLKSKKYLPSMAMIIAIDKSGSMACSCGMSEKSNTNNAVKIDLAKQSALATVSLLHSGDQIGVIAFDYNAKWVVPVQDAGNSKYIADQIASIRAGGGTAMYPALVEAEKALNGVPARLKHVIVLSDGRSEPGDFDGIVSKMASEKITLSTVAIGEDADVPMMTHLAEMGKGRYYYTDDINNLPKIFTKETLIASRSYLVEDPFIPMQLADSPAFRGLDMSKPPVLLGYVATRPKPRAEVSLVSPKRDPIFAEWQYGLGKSIAFTSDARARWAADWIRWQGFNKFWAQTVRWVLRSGSTGILHPQIEIVQGKGHIVSDTLDDKGQFVNFLGLDAQVVAPNLETQSVKLSQTAPGRYEGWFDAKQTGTYIANLAARDAGGKNVIDQQLSGASMSYSPEYKQLSINEQLLQKLSEVTGGKMITDPKQIFEHNLISRREPQDASQLLLTLALLLFTLDIFIRRLMLTREQFAWAEKFVPAFLWQGYMSKKKPTGEPAPMPEPVYAQLRQRKAVISQDLAPENQPIALSDAVPNPKPVVLQPPPPLPSIFSAKGMELPDTSQLPQTVSLSPDSPIHEDQNLQSQNGSSSIERLLEAKKRAQKTDVLPKD